MLKPQRYPKICTCAAREYFLADVELGNFLTWVTSMACMIDEMRDMARKALAETDHGQDDPRLSDTSREGQKGMIDELKRNRLILLHMLHERMTDNYLVYLTSILGEAFRCRPEILRSSETIEYAEVLGFQTIDDLVAHLAEKKVHDLSYKSIVDLEKFFQDRLGVPLVSADQRDELIKAAATRNIIVHNRGIRNKMYCSTVGENFNMVGKIRNIGIDYIRDTNVLFFLSVKGVDSALRKKLKIKGLRTDIRKEFAERKV